MVQIVENKPSRIPAHLKMFCQHLSQIIIRIFRYNLDIILVSHVIGFVFCVVRIRSTSGIHDARKVQLD